MHPRRRPRVKICCIASVEEAALAIRYGASAVGLVSAMPSGPGPIPEQKILEIAQTIPPGIGSFLLTSQTDTTAIVKQQRRCRTNTIQLCDRLVTGSYRDLRQNLPGISIVQVVHIRGEESIDEARRVSAFVDALLLDSGNQDLPVKELGGTGRVHDWAISRRICESVEIPVFLAGGLNATNVRQAIQSVQPFGVDLCSGVRTNRRLDETKLRDFFTAFEEPFDDQ